MRRGVPSWWAEWSWGGFPAGAPQRRPKSPSPSATDDLFRSRRSNILDQRHAVLRLAGLIEWSRFEREYGALYAEQGRPGLPTRLMVGLHFLKHIKALSDEQVCAQWVENPYFQAFCGETYFSARSTTATRSRLDAKVLLYRGQCQASL